MPKTMRAAVVDDVVDELAGEGEFIADELRECARILASENHDGWGNGEWVIEMMLDLAERSSHELNAYLEIRVDEILRELFQSSLFYQDAMETMQREFMDGLLAYHEEGELDFVWVGDEVECCEECHATYANAAEASYRIAMLAQERSDLLQQVDQLEQENAELRALLKRRMR